MKYIAHQSSKIWSYLQKYYTNNGILCVKRVENLLSGGDKSVRWGGKQKISRGHVLIRGGGTPWWVWSPNPHPPPDIGQPWSNSFLDSRSFGQVGVGHRSFRQCPVVQFSQLPPINGEVGGGVIIEKYFYSLFTCFWVYRSFLRN